MASGIFISYRREDSPGTAGRLFDRLSTVYTREQLFLDVDDIEPGMDFVSVLTERVASCEVLLVIIGRNWLAAKDENDQRRLDSPYDFVHLEVKAALDRSVRTIPVLVDQASMPLESELPSPLQALARRQAVRLGHDRFFADSEGLLRTLVKVVPPGVKTAGSLFASSSSQSSTEEASYSSIVSTLSATLSGKSSTYVSPNIPPQKEYNARVAWGMPADEQMEVLFDNSAFGSSKNFVAICLSGIYYRNWSEKFFISFDEFRTAVAKDRQSGLLVGEKTIMLLGDFRAQRDFLVALQKALRKAPNPKLTIPQHDFPESA